MRPGETLTYEFTPEYAARAIHSIREAEFAWEAAPETLDAGIVEEFIGVMDRETRKLLAQRYGMRPGFLSATRFGFDAAELLFSADHKGAFGAAKGAAGLELLGNLECTLTPYVSVEPEDGGDPEENVGEVLGIVDCGWRAYGRLKSPPPEVDRLLRLVYPLTLERAGGGYLVTLQDRRPVVCAAKDIAENPHGLRHFTERCLAAEMRLNTLLAKMQEKKEKK